MRRVRQTRPADGPTEVEMGALVRLQRDGPQTSAELARAERITPQSAGTTVAALEAQGLVARTLDPDDGRRRVIGVTDEGERMLRERRAIRTAHFARSLETEFDADELERLATAIPLLERLGRVL